MTELLIILCPPRSFSSVVSTVIGQHPEMYGLPELHLFVGDTMEDVMRREARRGKPQGPPGLLRTLAQLHDGAQTAETVLEARLWLDERRHWYTKKLYDYLLQKLEASFHPKLVVEKSPITVLKPQYIERAYAFFPKAYFLHLTRHPIATRASLQEFRDRKPKPKRMNPETGLPLDYFVAWALAHKNILNFTRTLPLAQSLQIKGEDLLSEPDVYLPQIAEWLGLRTDAEAVMAMKHPEHSPYANRGPWGARGGNDGKFMRSPHLREGRVREPTLKAMLDKGELQRVLDGDCIEELFELTHQLGYQ